jgi:signal transduction histidine kinase
MNSNLQTKAPDLQKEVEDLRTRLETLEREYHKSQSFSEQLMMSLSNDVGMITDLLHGALTVIQEELDSPNPDWSTVRETLASIAPLGVERAVQLRKFLEGAVQLAFRTKPLVLAPVSLREMIQRMMAESTTRIEESQLAVTIDLPEGISPVQAEEDIISRVFEVMLENALKFTPGADSVRIELSTSEGMQLVGIMDSDTSLSAQEVARRWEQSEKDTPQWMKDVRLIFCERALEAHKGRFWVETISEGWTAYRFSLPAGKAS